MKIHFGKLEKKSLKKIKDELSPKIEVPYVHLNINEGEKELGLVKNPKTGILEYEQLLIKERDSGMYKAEYMGSEKSASIHLNKNVKSNYHDRSDLSIIQDFRRQLKDSKTHKANKNGSEKIAYLSSGQVKNLDAVEKTLGYFIESFNSQAANNSVK